MAADVFVHPNALNESTDVGQRTRLWAFSHVMEGAVVGADCNLGDHSFIESGAQIGNGVTLKNGVAVWDGVTLEDYVFVGPNAVFTNDRFPRSPRSPVAAPRYNDHVWCESTCVRRGASIGANATIVCGTTIGRYAFVAAGAIVTKDVPDFTMVAGCPAEVVGFVCACGIRLPKVAEVLACESCGRRYERTSNGLNPIGGDTR